MMDYAKSQVKSEQVLNSERFKDLNPEIANPLTPLSTEQNRYNHSTHAPDDSVPPIPSLAHHSMLAGALLKCQEAPRTSLMHHETLGRQSESPGDTLPRHDTIVRHEDSAVVLDNASQMSPFQVKSEVPDVVDGSSAFFYDHILQPFTTGVTSTAGINSGVGMTVDHNGIQTVMQQTGPEGVQAYNFYYNIQNTNLQSTIPNLDPYSRHQQGIFQSYGNISNNVIRNSDASLLESDMKRRKEIEVANSNIETAILSNRPANSKEILHQANSLLKLDSENKNVNNFTQYNQLPGNLNSYFNGDKSNLGFKDENSYRDSDKNQYTNDETTYKSLINAEYANIKGEYVCWKCKNVFSTKRDLKHHSKHCKTPENVSEDTIFRGNTSEGQTESKSAKFQCDLCPYKCQSPAILKIHERTHSGEKPYSCKFCDYKSGQKNNVAKHILVHMKEKPFRCQYCEYRCAQKNNLVVHERTHTGFKPFACTFCDYKTVQKPNLVKHMYLHTNQKPFSCDICNYRCVQKTNLIKHKQKHVGEKYPNGAYVAAPKPKTFRCDLCTYRCVQKTSLDRHRQNKHNIIKSETSESYSNEGDIVKTEDQQRLFSGRDLYNENSNNGSELSQNLATSPDENLLYSGLGNTTESIQNLSVRKDAFVNSVTPSVTPSITPSVIQSVDCEKVRLASSDQLI